MDRIPVEGSVDQGHRPQPPVLPGRQRELVELEVQVQRRIVEPLGRQRDDGRHRDEHEGHGEQRAVAPARREVPPRPVRRRCLAESEDRRPGGDRRGLVVEPVADLAEPEERRRGDRRIVETDDAGIVIAGRLEVPRLEQLRPALQHREGFAA